MQRLLASMPGGIAVAACSDNILLGIFAAIHARDEVLGGAATLSGCQLAAAVLDNEACRIVEPHPAVTVVAKATLAFVGESTHEINEDVYVDLDAEGHVVSMTIEHARRNSQLPHVFVQGFDRRSA
jgi:uncharacterized protein YuzE